MRRMLGLARMRRGLLLAGLALAVLPAGSALADTTIGNATAGNELCQSQQIFGDTSLRGARRGGTITSFSYESETSNAGQQLSFLVLRSAGGSNYTVVGRTRPSRRREREPWKMFPANNIPVQGGDILGLWTAPTAGPLSRSSSPGSGLIFDNGIVLSACRSSRSQPGARSTKT